MKNQKHLLEYRVVGRRNALEKKCLNSTVSKKKTIIKRDENRISVILIYHEQFRILKTYFK